MVSAHKELVAKMKKTPVDNLIFPVNAPDETRDVAFFLKFCMLLNRLWGQESQLQKVSGMTTPSILNEVVRTIRPVALAGVAPSFALRVSLHAPRLRCWPRRSRCIHKLLQLVFPAREHVRGVAVKDLGAFHQRFRQRRMRMDRTARDRTRSRPFRSPRHASLITFACAVTDDAVPSTRSVSGSMMSFRQSVQAVERQRASRGAHGKLATFNVDPFPFASLSVSPHHATSGSVNTTAGIMY